MPFNKCTLLSQHSKPYAEDGEEESSSEDEMEAVKKNKEETEKALPQKEKKSKLCSIL